MGLDASGEWPQLGEGEAEMATQTRGGSASMSQPSKRRLLDILAASMEDPDSDEGAWCGSRDLVVACVSLLLVLRLSMGPNSADGHAGVAAAESRLLARALSILLRMVSTRDGKRLFLLYGGVPMLSMLLRSRNLAIRASAATLVLTLSADGALVST